MIVAAARLTLIIPENDSLKGKRKVVKSLIEKARHKFDAAIEESEKKNPAGMAGFGSLLNYEGHRDTLAFVDTMTHK
jgi:uncharacterized protein YlxP (DUF503 family)